MADEYKYDVFISYSHKDEEWADKVLRPNLENAGLKVCIDYRDFPAGKPAIINMQEAAKTSKQTVLVLTQNWLDSEWTFFESIITGTKDPSGMQQRLIPLLCEEGIEANIPEFISVRTWVDFIRKDREAIAWKQLFTALGKPDAPIPVTTPEEPKPETSPNWCLAHPYPMPPNFTGRETERKLLTNWLTNDAENRLFILCALGGFGKSALAWHWLTHDVNAKDWPKVIWWSFYEGDASFENFIKETLEYLNVEVPPGQRQQVDTLLKAMQAQKILLIMDGFERALRAYSSMNAAYQSDEESLTSLTPQPLPLPRERKEEPRLARRGMVRSKPTNAIASTLTPKSS